MGIGGTARRALRAARSESSDIGDGAIHRPEYRCDNGAEPIGTIPVGIEGSVCCGS